VTAFIHVKRGETLIVPLTITTTGGSGLATTGDTVICEIRDAEHVLVASPSLIAGGTVGDYTATVLDTSAFPEGLLRMDLLIIEADGERTIGQTIGIEVERAMSETMPEQAPYDPVTDG
jgi:hypothetical protein